MEEFFRHTYKDPIIFLVDQILHDAISIGASDIHFEMLVNSMRLRYRIDGSLYEQKSISQDRAQSVVSRLKILSNLDIAQSRVPQDGKFGINFSESGVSRDVEMRVSTFPSIHGEKVVVRILDTQRKKISLKNLGCSPAILKNIQNIIDRPHGFFIVTGPTGSGKTTTLYAILSELNIPERNIVTMEDPVEYQIDGITQSQVNPSAGFTFERGLRSILRQDPDVVMIGEIRDRQTAKVAIRAALTGHLVLSTLHTNDSVGAVARLIDMGVEPFLISASVVGVLAQRLVKKLCVHCRHEIAKGCDRCSHLGHAGRTGIFELFTVDETVKKLIVDGVDSGERIRQHAVEAGMSFLRDDAIEKVSAGVISFDEMLCVVG